MLLVRWTSNSGAGQLGISIVGSFSLGGLGQAACRISITFQVGCFVRHPHPRACNERGVSTGSVSKLWETGSLIIEGGGERDSGSIVSGIVED